MMYLFIYVYSQHGVTMTPPPQEMVFRNFIYKSAHVIGPSSFLHCIADSVPSPDGMSSIIYITQQHVVIIIVCNVRYKQHRYVTGTRIRTTYYVLMVCYVVVLVYYILHIINKQQLTVQKVPFHSSFAD